MAPIIPSINSHEILARAKSVSEAGALNIAHTTVRLTGAISRVFMNWIIKTPLDKTAKV